MSGETEKDESGWTIDTIKYYTDEKFDAVAESITNLKEMLDERYRTQTKATDAAFVAQQEAMKTAFIAADKAVQTALLSAKEAVNKAEMANEKRFESVNEFRGQLNDQANTFMPRTEVAAIQIRNTERIQDLTDRMNLYTGSRNGAYAAIGVAVSIAAIATSIFIYIITSIT